MTSPEVEWVLDQFASVVDDVATTYTLENGDPVTLIRVDRDETRAYEGTQTIDMSTPIRDREGELRSACYVGASLTDRASTPIGTEYDHQTEAIVSVRIEGLHESAFGHVDPDGTDGVPWQTYDKTGLVDRLRTALTDARTFPDAGNIDTGYKDLLIDGHDPQLAAWADYYRTDLDVRFAGFEEL